MILLRHCRRPASRTSTPSSPTARPTWRCSSPTTGAASAWTAWSARGAWPSTGRSSSTTSSSTRSPRSSSTRASRWRSATSGAASSCGSPPASGGRTSTSCAAASTRVYVPPGGAHGSSTGAAEILFVGRLLHGKGLSLLFEAIAELRRRGLEVTATVVGDGPARDEAEHDARRLELVGARPLPRLRRAGRHPRSLRASRRLLPAELRRGHPSRGHGGDGDGAAGRDDAHHGHPRAR